MFKNPRGTSIGEFNKLYGEWSDVYNSLPNKSGEPAQSIRMLLSKYFMEGKSSINDNTWMVASQILSNIQSHFEVSSIGNRMREIKEKNPDVYRQLSSIL